MKFAFYDCLNDKMQLCAHWNPRVKTTSKIAAGRSLPEGILDVVLLINSLTLNSQNGVNELQTTHNNRFTALCTGLHGQAGTRRNTHPPTNPPSWSSSNLYQLLSSTTMHSILPVQITCFAILLHDLSLCPLWSTSWSGALHLLTLPYLTYGVGA